MSGVRFPGWRRYFSGQGRLSRGGFAGGLLALFMAFCLIAALLSIALAVGAVPEQIGRWVFAGACAVLVFPLLAILSQRGQDFGLSGTVVAVVFFLCLAPALMLIVTPVGLVATAPFFVGLAGFGVWALVSLALVTVPGQKRENSYGPDPLIDAEAGPV